MKNFLSCVFLVVCALLTPRAWTAPLVEINSDSVHLSLLPYVDILEDKNGGLTIEDVMSERYAFQFAPASMTELFFGFSTSAYWMRFTVENQRDVNMNFILEAAPADIDYVDLYVIDPQSGQLRKHDKLGTATPYSDRAYNYPLNLFDIKIEPHAAYTYYVRAESDKAINLQLSLTTPHEYLSSTNTREWRQGFLIGGLLLIAIVNLGLYAVFHFKAFLWRGLSLLAVTAVQAAWNGYLLQFYDSNEALLDHQIMTPIYLAIFFGVPFSQYLLDTKKRVPWQHRTLTGIGLIAFVGSIATWFISPHASALIIAWLASFYVVFVFAVALHANMEEHPLARHFIAVRAITVGVVLVAIFNVNGYLPQGAFTMWGVAAAVIVESIVMAISMAWHCLQSWRENIAQANEAVESQNHSHSLVNLSDICHELRTPISGVMGMAELLLTGTVTDQQRSQLKTIQRSGQALLDVTNKLSDLSSIERGNIELNSAPFELLPLIESCIENCRGRAEFNNIELIYHLDNSVAGFIKGDQEKLQHILVNLLQFALRNVEQGEVVLSVKMMDDTHTAFTIRSGQNTLMERNIPESTRDLGSSDHLNLTIAEQYIKLMGGTLALQSFIDGGVSIQFSLQLEAHFSQTQQGDDNRILQGRHLLIVDDNATCCSIIEQQAAQWGMTVHSAYGGKEALALLRSHTTMHEPFDIVLIDYEMPSMDGLELAAHIRDDQKIDHNKLLMIMLTGVSKAPSKILSENAAIQRVLYKPLSGKSLKQALQSALAQHLNLPH